MDCSQELLKALKGKHSIIFWMLHLERVLWSVATLTTNVSNLKARKEFFVFLPLRLRDDSQALLTEQDGVFLTLLELNINILQEARKL